MEGYIILSVDLCVSGHALEGFQISARAVEKQLRVVVCAFLEAALCQAEEAGHQCNVTNLPPFVGTLLFLSDVESILNSVKGEGKVELVILIWGHREGEILLSISFQEFS